VGAGGRLRGVVGTTGAPAVEPGTAGPPSQLVEAGVADDPVRPGGEGGPAVETSDVAGDEDQRLLEGVLGIGVVAREPPAQPPPAVVVAAQQAVERAPVAVLGGGDE